MEWIKCSERMPEVGVKVLFFLAGDEPVHGVWGGFSWMQDVSWSVTDNGEYIDNMITSKVTHWMPLPPPPTE